MIDVGDELLHDVSHPQEFLTERQRKSGEASPARSPVVFNAANRTTQRGIKVKRKGIDVVTSESYPTEGFEAGSLCWDRRDHSGYYPNSPAALLDRLLLVDAREPAHTRGLRR